MQGFLFKKQEKSAVTGTKREFFFLPQTLSQPVMVFLFAFNIVFSGIGMLAGQMRPSWAPRGPVL